MKYWVGLLKKKERKKFKIKLKLPKLWWLVGVLIIFALFSGIFRGTDNDIPDYMTTIDTGDDKPDPSHYKEIESTSNLTQHYRYPAYQSNDPAEVILRYFKAMPILLLIGLGLAIPFTIVFSRLFIRKW